MNDTDPYRERFEDSDMTLQQYFNRQDEYTAYCFSLWLFVIMTTVCLSIVGYTFYKLLF